jgi:hypothetical protein
VSNIKVWNLTSHDQANAAHQADAHSKYPPFLFLILGVVVLSGQKHVSSRAANNKHEVDTAVEDVEGRYPFECSSLSIVPASRVFQVIVLTDIATLSQISHRYFVS